MRSLLFATAIITGLTASVALADGTKYVNYSIYNKKEVVKGKFFVNGYSIKQILTYISQDCKGKVGQIALVGKPRKKRGNLIQKYQTTCTGGLASQYKGSGASIEVEKMPDGRNLVEIITSDGAGNILFLKKYR